MTERYYHGRRGLVLLGIDPQRVASPIRWEALGTPEPYPHVYGPLNIDAVVTVWDFEPLADGSFELPE